MLPTKFNFI